MSATAFNPRSTCCTHTPSTPENKSPWKGLATAAILIGGVLITKKLTSRVGKASSAFGTVGLIATIWSQHFPSSVVNSSNDFSKTEQKLQYCPEQAPYVFHELLRLLLEKEMNDVELAQANQCISKVWNSLPQDITQSVTEIRSINFDNLSTELCMQGVIPSDDDCTELDEAQQTILNVAKGTQKAKIGEILDCLEQNDFNVRFEETKRCLESPDYDNQKKLFQLFMFITLSEEDGDQRVRTAFSYGKFLELVKGKKIDFEEALSEISERLTPVEVIKLFKEAQDQNRALHCNILCDLMEIGDHKDDTLNPLKDFEKRYLSNSGYPEEKHQKGYYFESNPLGYTAKNLISELITLISNNPGKSFADIVNPEKSFVDTGDGSSESLEELD